MKICLIVAILAGAIGCSRGPDINWVKEKVRKKISACWTENNQTPREGVDYTFGKFKMAKGGKEGRLYFSIPSRLYRNKVKYSNELHFHAFEPGEHYITVEQDKYGEWHISF